MKKKVLSVLLLLWHIIVATAQEQTIYTGPMSISNWQGVTVPASVLADAGQGDVVRVYVSQLLGSDRPSS